MFTDYSQTFVSGGDLGVECLYTNKSDGQNCACLMFPICESSIYGCFQESTSIQRAFTFWGA